ncbi:zona pellucida sperm-binding protein 3-like [Astyanax mexicanus]|uniref:Zona pellucida sperm-binding protein 3-like n=1 Tax=Astyanax mexicanus TaxID=7994 RepID=A0A8T2MBS4_ASTMX|nr:zona pellucida sperm-binding protein 3-like [Astyanax mexicanus]
MYRQGEVINLKASVARTERTPAKLYVDTCVFTLQPDVGHTPRYPLIHNHGCSANPRSLLPTAHFLPRSEDHSLRLQMETRRFSRNEQITVYIRCVLKVTAEEESSVNKACSFTGERWSSVDGQYSVCDCCDSVCEEDHQYREQSREFKGSAAADSGRAAVVSLGPVVILP